MAANLMNSIARTAAMDGMIANIAHALEPVMSRQKAHYLLSGHWLGHRAHPRLTDAVVGTWLSAALLDCYGERYADASRTLVVAGAALAVPTVTTGLSDWLHESEKVQRVGLVHALGNAVALTLQLASANDRRKGNVGKGKLWSLAAMAVTTASGWIGGHMAFEMGAGVEASAS